MVNQVYSTIKGFGCELAGSFGTAFGYLKWILPVIDSKHTVVDKVLYVGLLI